MANRIKRIEQLVEALRQKDTGYLNTLKSWPDIKTIAYIDYGLDEIVERIADLIKEVLEND